LHAHLVIQGWHGASGFLGFEEDFTLSGRENAGDWFCDLGIGGFPAIFDGLEVAVFPQLLPVFLLAVISFAGV